MNKLLFVLSLILLIPIGLGAQLENAWNYGFVIKPADTVIITADTLYGMKSDTTLNTATLGSAAKSPRGISIFNWTSGETLLINENGNVPTLSYSPWTTNSFPLIGPESYVSTATTLDSLILWVPSDSCIINIRWSYKR